MVEILLSRIIRLQMSSDCTCNQTGKYLAMYVPDHIGSGSFSSFKVQSQQHNL